MRLLLDQGLPRSTVNELQKLKIESIHVGDIGMAASKDSDILSKAVEEDCVVVTLDSDFHTILATHKSDKPSVIRLRIEGLKSKELADIIAVVLQSAETEIRSGSAVSVDRRGIRVRSLPLIQ